MSLPATLPFSVSAAVPVSGGNLNAAYRVESGDGAVVFVKTSADAADGAFAAEAAGLAWLAAADGGPPVPEVVAVGTDFLALEWIDPGPRDDVAFGHGLACLHRAGAAAYGSLPPGVSDGLRIGPLCLPVSATGSWAEVWSEQLVAPLVREAAARGALSDSAVALVEDVQRRFENLAGQPEPESRLHGDLWSGNALGAHVIDPAAYGGHREMDLAMMALFGGFSDTCRAAYAEAFPLADGWGERVGLWQLFPLLLHTVLFAGGYGARVESVARRYV